jgi:multimeric flavodoxin WrbA
VKRLLRKIAIIFGRRLGGLSLLRAIRVHESIPQQHNKRFLVINVSPHKNSITQQFAKTFISQCKLLGIETTEINLWDEHIPPSNGTYEQLNLRMQTLTLESDGVFIASPTYWYNVPATLKAYIECLTNIEDELYERSRPICLAVHSPEGGELGVIQSILLPMNMMGFWIPENAYAYYRGKQDDWAWEEVNGMPGRMSARMNISPIHASTPPTKAS